MTTVFERVINRGKRVTKYYFFKRVRAQITISKRIAYF